MIPKQIHCVWLSGEEKPELIKKCMASWQRVLPDYAVKEWSAADFDFSKFPAFVQEALSVRKWAFVTDYLRLYLLYNYGGIYMDTDIYIRKPIDSFLDNQFFSFMEYHPKGFRPFADRVDENGYAKTDQNIPGMCMQAAFMGSVPGHIFLQKCMDYYRQRHYLQEDGSQYNVIIAPDIFALTAREFGFRYLDTGQDLSEGMKIYPSSFTAGALTEMKRGNYAVHCCANSWVERSGLRKKLREARNKILETIYLR